MIGKPLYCPKCGSGSVMVARDMISTRMCCHCHNKWTPNEDNNSTFKKRERLREKYLNDIVFHKTVQAVINHHQRMGFQDMLDAVWLAEQIKLEEFKIQLKT